MAENGSGEKAEAKVVHRFKAAPERVYDAWPSPETVRIWLKAALKQSGLEGDLKTIDRKWAEYVPRTQRGWTRMLEAVGELLART